LHKNKDIVVRMEYTKKFNELKNVFNPDVNEILIPGSDISIVNERFVSDEKSIGFSSESDRVISENNNFTYPVFVPGDKSSKKVILLLHGLNERSWVKYLAWAYYLAENTGSYVVLFPISFHINRSPVSWKDPRAMVPFVNERKIRYGVTEMASFANIALSNRLTEDPLRFLNSGHRTVGDIVLLMNIIKSGNHPVIPAGSKVNIFAYSIGAFLAEIIMMGNPENLFSESKLFMFCGGSVFSNMHGTSKLIMDSLAYEKIYKFYLSDFENEIIGKGPVVEFLRTSRVGMAFRSMIDLGRFRTFREKALKGLRDQVHAIALLKDSVIPAKGISETMNFDDRHHSYPSETWDFSHHYYHENPFPVYDNHDSKLVDHSFERLFTKAALFLI
jgi:hypothetical protein